NPPTSTESLRTVLTDVHLLLNHQSSMDLQRLDHCVQSQPLDTGYSNNSRGMEGYVRGNEKYTYNLS
ncbi:MAG: hypothetical protein MJE68_01305, partial [Proteobacteria bacterium]|nr:hypothetical protein [Pseudomonadota bacterium]